MWILIFSFIIIYFNYFEFLCILKNLLGKDFPIKEHDVDNEFLKKQSNIFDIIYYEYSEKKLNELKINQPIQSLPTMLPNKIKYLREKTNNYRKPIVIKGLIKEFDCVKKWNISYLKKECGKCKVIGIENANILNQFNNVKIIKDLDFSKACDMIENNEKIYINNFHSIFWDCENIQKDLNISKMEKMISMKYKNCSQLFFGPKGTGTTLHCAMKSNFFFNIKGRKKWTFIDPKYSKYMKGALSDSALFVVSKLDYFKNKSILDKIPKYEIILEEGDVLFNPCWWWHCVENLSNYTIGVANRSSLGFKIINSNNNLYTLCTIITRPYQLYKLYSATEKDNKSLLDVDVTGKTNIK